jgi:hypothetical protein
MDGADDSKEDNAEKEDDKEDKGLESPEIIEQQS